MSHIAQFNCSQHNLPQSNKSSKLLQTCHVIMWNFSINEQVLTRNIQRYTVILIHLCLLCDSLSLKVAHSWAGASFFCFLCFLIVFLSQEPLLYVIFLFLSLHCVSSYVSFNTSIFLESRKPSICTSWFGFPPFSPAPVETHHHCCFQTEHTLIAVK